MPAIPTAASGTAASTETTERWLARIQVRGWFICMPFCRAGSTPEASTAALSRHCRAADVTPRQHQRRRASAVVAKLTVFEEEDVSRRKRQREQIVAALRQHENALASGAIVTLDERQVRVRVLPF